MSMIACMDSNPTTASLRTPADREVPGLLAELADSCDSLASFARSRGLSTWKLYEARRKCSAKKAPAPIFDPVRIVAAPAPSSPIELEHSSGHLLRVPSGFDATTLRRVIEVLESC